MILHHSLCVGLLLALVASQPTTLSFLQNVPTGGNGTITGPIYVGPTLADGIITSSGPSLSYWVKNSSSLYALNQTWAPLNVTSYQNLATEYNGAQGFGAAGSDIQAANGFELKTGVYGSPNQTLIYTNDTVGAYNITAIGFTLAGNKLVTGNTDGSINVWNRNSTTNVYTSAQKLTGHTAAIKQLAVGLTYTIISLSTNGEVFDWEYTIANNSYSLNPNPVIANVTTVAICADGDSGYFVGLSNGSIAESRWDASGKRFALNRTYNGSHAAPVDSIAVSRTCDRLVSAADNLILWNYNYTSQGYDPVPAITGYDPAYVRQTPTEVAVAVTGTGEYKVYSIVLNCSNVSNAVSQVNSTTCSCKANYTWRYEYCYQINCSLFTNATTLFNATACNCATDYKWNFDALACQINCKLGWTPVNGVCVFDCKNIYYTKSSTPNSDGSCQCASNYVWEKKISQCVSTKSSQSLAIGLGVGLGVGLPVAAALLAVCCLCFNSPTVPHAPPPAAAFPQPIGSTSYLVAKPGSHYPTGAFPNTNLTRVAMAQPSGVRYP